MTFAHALQLAFVACSPLLVHEAHKNATGNAAPK